MFTVKDGDLKARLATFSSARYFQAKDAEFLSIRVCQCWIMETQKGRLENRGFWVSNCGTQFRPAKIILHSPGHGSRITLTGRHD